jgi:hypothetical protein
MFPYDQRVVAGPGQPPAVFLSPRFVSSVVTAAVSSGATMGLVPLAGAQSGFLNGTSDSRLSRTLSFSPGHLYTFSWMHDVFLYVGNLVGEDAAPFGPRYQVVLRDPSNGALLDTLFATTVDVSATESVSISGALLPAQAVLSFELRADAQSWVELDSLTIDDGSGPVDPGNGDFETGLLAPWVASTGDESQNVRSGSRLLPLDPLGAVTVIAVTRTVYAPPNAGWARIVDVFDNQGASTVTTSAVYSTLLSIGAPLSVAPPNGVVVAWDPALTAYDLGLVVGDGAPGHGTAYVADADPQIFFVHDLVVAPGAKAALVHFVVVLGEAAGGSTTADVPANTKAACDAIASGFPAADVFWQDLEPSVMQAIANF